MHRTEGYDAELILEFLIIGDLEDISHSPRNTKLLVIMNVAAWAVVEI